jgi:hypothetical protein
MSISGVSNTGLLQQWNAASPQQQWDRVLQVRQDFSQLALDLQSGDLADARKAYADLQSLQASSVAGTSIPADFAALGQTLATNSLSEALSDSALLQSGLNSALQNQFGPDVAHGHRGHHHPNGTDPNLPHATDPNLPYATADAVPSSTGTAIDVTA